MKGVAFAATVGSGVAPAGVRPAGGTPSDRPPAAPTWKRAPCRLCGVGCGLLVGVEADRAVAVKGDPESPVGGGLACAKGYYAAQILYGRDRITRAMVRRNGALVAVPLGEALDLVATRLREAVQRHGKDSVGVYGSAQWTIPDAYVAAKLFKGGLGTNNVDSSTRLYGASAMAGLTGSFGLDGAIGCYEDVDHADVFVLWDANLAETDPVLFSRILDRRRRDPTVRIVDLATRTTRTSYAADHAALFSPGTGLAVANAICREIVARRWVDRDFVDRHVAFKKSRATSASAPAPGEIAPDEPVDASWSEYESFLASYAPERAQELSGTPAATIRWLASLYGDRARRVATVWGTSVHQDAHGTWMNNALFNIHLLVGKIGEPGNGPLAASGQPNGGSAVHDAGSLAHTLPRGVVASEADRRRAAEIWGVPPDRLDPRPGRTALSLFRALSEGSLRCLWIQATNPAVSLPGWDRLRLGSRSADRFVVVSEAYPTPTTDIADVVLPAALWIEREGVLANTERRMQHFARMVPAPGDAAPDAWHMIEVGRRLGLGQLFPWEPGRLVEQIWEEYARFHDHPSTAIPPLATLRAGAGARWPYADGRETRWRYSTAHDPAADRAHGAFDFYGHADHRAWVWLRPHTPPADAPDGAYPLWLVTGAVLEHWGGGAMTRRIPALHRAVPGAYAEISREDAARLGIRSGDRVRVVSRHGAIQLEARIDYRSQPPRGEVFVPWFDESVQVNRLMGGAACPQSGQPERKCAVRLERITAG